MSFHFMKSKHKYTMGIEQKSQSFQCYLVLEDLFFTP